MLNKIKCLFGFHSLNVWIDSKNLNNEFIKFKIYKCSRCCYEKLEFKG